MTARRGLVVVAAATLAGATLVAQTIQINGAGATFPYPIYSKWFAEYNKLHSNVEINYQSIGSGGGIRGASTVARTAKHAMPPATATARLTPAPPPAPGRTGPPCR